MCGTERVGVKTIMAISQHCPNIEELDIGSCGQDDDLLQDNTFENALRQLSVGCPRLKTLVAWDIPGLGPEFMKELQGLYCMEQFWLEPPVL
jgi:hypothetical protein